MSVVEIDYDVPNVFTEENRTTDNSAFINEGLDTQTAHENRTQEVLQKSRIGWTKRTIGIGAFATAFCGQLTASSFVEEYLSVPVEIENAAGLSIAESIAKIVDQYESVFFSYPARVIEIENNSSGDSVSATIIVSVDGNDTIIKRSVQDLNFKVEPDMHLIVDGVKRGDIKKLSFRVAQPLDLDEEQERLLGSLVASFRS